MGASLVIKVGLTRLHLDPFERQLLRALISSQAQQLVIPFERYDESYRWFRPSR